MRVEMDARRCGMVLVARSYGLATEGGFPETGSADWNLRTFLLKDQSMESLVTTS